MIDIRECGGKHKQKKEREHKFASVEKQVVNLFAMHQQTIKKQSDKQCVMFAIEGTKFFVLQMLFFTFKNNALNDGDNQSYEKEDNKKVVTHN